MRAVGKLARRLALLAPARQQPAIQIEDAINEFEPRLQGVRVLVQEAQGEFRYEIVTRLVDSGADAIALRVLTPRRGGGLGAEVLVLGFAGDDAT